MKLYLYNCNYLNEFLEEIETDFPEQWDGCSTEVPPVESNIIGRSYAFNPDTQAWDVLIEDWRKVTLYKKEDSRITTKGEVKPRPLDFIEIAPPDNEKQYVWNDNLGSWQEYIEMVNPAEVIKKYERVIQNYIDFTAQQRGYDNGYTCASYFDDKNARYASDARIFKDWRSDVWVFVNQLLNQYANAFGENTEIPASQLAGYPTPEDVIAQLPAIEWEDL